METGLSRTESRATIEGQNWKLLGYFNYYRLTIALAAVAISFFIPNIPPFGIRTPALFQIAALAYAALGVLALLTIRERRFDFETHTTLLTFADVALLTMLMHASGGLPSGLGMLLLIAIAGGSLMLGRRITVFYASLAAIAVMLEHSWDYLTGSVASLLDLSQGYPQVGMLGVGFIATAFLGNMLAERLRATEALAERRGVDLANLTQVNALIIQHMQIGVLVCDAGGNIRLSNQAAQKFLNLGAPSPTRPQALTAVSPDLAIQLFRWLGDEQGVRSRSAFTTRNGYRILPRFTALGEDKDAGALIFLEDLAVLKQQAQQMKMESLARLTASIAHEIRNPLGALSNAAQLLGETPQQNGEGQRLIKIIDDQSRRMNVIVENVTQLSRRDHVSPMRFLLDPWLQEFARQYADTTRVPREIFSFTTTEGIEVCMDPEQLHQVVANLCQNALRHSPPYTGSPLIRLDSGLDTEQRPTLDIIDWGTGVAPDIVDFIFDPFFTTTPKGTGLGLYIARELCEGNGATLDYHPGEGKIGCRFHVTFTRPENCLETSTA
jgi:two-component system sensor histidine kinase PilS (NtrC family)